MKHKSVILAAFVLLKFLLQYTILLSPEYDLQRDEYLHLDQGLHLAWGYVSVPPFTSWLSLIIHALGASEFWVRFFPCLFGALTMVVVWQTVKVLGGNLFAHILAATCVLLSVLLRLNQLFQPNSFDVLAWATLYFTLINYMKTRKPAWLYGAAVIFAFGFLNKYNIAFQLIGLIPALIVTAQRRIFLDKHLYFAALLALVLILPNLYWQYANHFPVLHHMKELSRTQLVNVSRAGFLKEQLIYFIGSLVVIVAGLYALLFYKDYQPWRFLFYAFFFTLAVFLFFRAKGYYAIGLYPIYIPFGCVFLSRLAVGRRAVFVQIFLMHLPVVFFIRMFLIAFPNKSPEEIVANSESYRKIGMLRWEDGRDHRIPQDFADMLSWKELARKVDSAYVASPDPAATLVLCDNYGQAGAINYYSRRNIRAVSFNADYLNWFDFSRPYRHLIRVKSWEQPMDELETTAPYFRTAAAADSIRNSFAREWGTTIYVFHDAKIDINARIKEEIAETQAQNIE